MERGRPRALPGVLPGVPGEAAGEVKRCSPLRRCRVCRGKPGERSRCEALVRRYGISAADYDALLEQGHGVCWLCGAEEWRRDARGKPTRLSVEHDHATGKVRGLCCNRCNAMLGDLADPALFGRRLLAYMTGAHQALHTMPLPGHLGAERMGAREVAPLPCQACGADAGACTCA